MQALWIFFKGLLMGAADVIPGVSGGTMAFITGIYDRLVNAIADLSAAGKALLGMNMKQANDNIDWSLFLPLGAGIMIAFLIGSAYIPALMDAYTAEVFGFFIGLIAASSYIVWKHIREHSAASIAMIIAGIMIGGIIASLPFLEAEPGWGFLFILGMIAVTAMILPGISGSYILLMFGQYQYILEAIHNRAVAILAVFAAGAIIGILAFAHLLKHLLSKYHALTFSALLGIMLGALVRPGRIALEHMANPLVTGALVIAGAGIVLVIERMRN